MDKLIRLPSGCWQIAGDSNSLFEKSYFKKFPFHSLAAQARAIEQIEKSGNYIGLKPIAFHNLKTERKTK